ncbi:hypothetical protein P152DRAFT_504785 [Eremomyces bilateralis CBS 781.70]|uniref:MFS general substrate transporter n=1 Tax=Eremomyces bilateralis CBS 781.70 TaxID=1392243 RepID=A0A6G1GI89_9PEZI|nr:uncharacterized protein P152DRAFT_504785 [Eremomyces bilateralis CBS 781.70]KAF1817599.1 hypothetical protein P152DRAFT_504785 [Eremomyces bilateralis CBS 781.70]
MNLTIITLFVVFQGIAPSFWSPLSDSFDGDRCPIIGGGTALATGDPRWCFRTLLIFGGPEVLFIGWAMLETGRTIVGSGAVPAAGMVWRTWWSFVAKIKLRGRTRSNSQGNGISIHESITDAISLDNVVTVPTLTTNANLIGRATFMMPNPIPSIRLLFFDTFLTLWLADSLYALWFYVQTSLTPIFTLHHGNNPLEVGLCFLAGGLGIILVGFIARALMDRNYKQVAKEIGFSVDCVRGDDISQFPIEHARSRRRITITLVSMCVVVGYGWAGYIACKCTILLQTFSALIVDIFPNAPGTAAESNKITRCILAAGVIAALDPLVSAMGYRWLFTLLEALDAGSCTVATGCCNREYFP